MDETPNSTLTGEQRAELHRRDAEMDAHPERALTWKQIRESVEAKM
jgi:putative addiction module component (TIGR02574 family)